MEQLLSLTMLLNALFSLHGPLMLIQLDGEVKSTRCARATAVLDVNDKTKYVYDPGLT